MCGSGADVATPPRVEEEAATDASGVEASNAAEDGVDDALMYCISHFCASLAAGSCAGEHVACNGAGLRRLTEDAAEAGASPPPPSEAKEDEDDAPRNSNLCSRRNTIAHSDGDGSAPDVDRTRNTKSTGDADTDSDAPAKETDGINFDSMLQSTV